MVAGNTLCELQVIMCVLMMLVYYLFYNAETSNVFSLSPHMQGHAVCITILKVSSQLEKLFRLTFEASTIDFDDPGKMVSMGFNY